MLWCVDTSAWIDAVRFYNPASPLFERLWGFLEQEILAGRVISPKAVHDELREKTLGDSPPFAARVKRVKGSLFAEETPELQARFAVIVNQYPDLTKKGKPFARSDADAWVIALAEIRGALVVSQERPSRRRRSHGRSLMWPVPEASRRYRCTSSSTAFRAFQRREPRAAGSDQMTKSPASAFERTVVSGGRRATRVPGAMLAVRKTEPPTTLSLPTTVSPPRTVALA